jgi:hypothetical protein
LIVRDEGTGNGAYQFRTSVLSAGSKAAVFSGSKEVRHDNVKKLLATLDSTKQHLSLAAIDQFGDELAKLVLPNEICAVLETILDHHLVVVHDGAGSRFPWETVRINGLSPALNCGLSRRYLADDLPLAKWVEQRRRDGVLDILLVVNPTKDLSGADGEGDRIRRIAASIPGLKLTELAHEEATRLALLNAVRSGKYDVLHFAGHAFFDERDPGRSGLVCAREEVLVGGDLTGIGSLPSLVFFNACEAAKTRRASTGTLSGKRSRKDGSPQGEPLRSERARQTASIAESLLRGGVANFIGTYWPVGDDAASQFAEAFYNAALKSRTLGSAILDGRRAIRADKSSDWADYVLYGSYDFVLEESAQ